MGRGAGDLQKWIVDRANQNAKHGQEPAVSFAEVKLDRYKMPGRKSQKVTSWRFNKRRLRRYNAISVAISKAARRLADRGLAEVVPVQYDDGTYGTDIVLTDAGRLVATLGFKPLISISESIPTPEFETEAARRRSK